ncbi:MFS transporter [Promicromonospora sp. NPDC023805]|uniref:MFS transporter n=1 Tax=Promicromonospora sp. NPDC023805 TaxID=3154696 RepID=UPI0033C7A613
MSEAATIEPSARPRDWVALALLVLPCTLISVNSNLLNLAMPALAAELRPTAGELLWISDVYVFLVAGLLLPMGALADRFGRRRMLLIGAAVFGAASVGAAFAPWALALIAWRALIGVGAAMIAPSTIALIRSMFRVPRQRAAALGIWTAGFAVGGILGPVIGGFLIAAVDWRAVFAVTPPAMVALLVLGPLLLPEHRSATSRRMDVVGVALGIAGILATVYAIKQLAAAAEPVLPLLSGIGGVALLIGFGLHIRRTAHPVLDASLFQERTLTVPQAGNALAFAVLYGTQLLIGQYLQSVLGMTPLEAGLWTIPSAVAYAVGGLLAPRLEARLGAPNVLALGLTVSAAGFAIMGLVGTGSGVVPFVAGSIVSALGLAPLYQVTTALAMSTAPRDRAGTAGATLETTTNLGGALGIALFGSVASAAYRLGTAGGGTQSIGDAATTAAHLPPAQAEALLEAASSAFVDGFRLVVLSGAVLLFVAAALTRRLLRSA